MDPYPAAPSVGITKMETMPDGNRFSCSGAIMPLLLMHHESLSSCFRHIVGASNNYIQKTGVKDGFLAMMLARF